ncbi:hypothetical protein CCC_00980 [Paramagnetospirillum magnetotacticum MS-1]|uniref:Uncharacterized protein n=1 Tax=Paramagnetospirillum magnetotacticum MS-1 TaxID=272627 RepID=A0A0C2YDY6_PARME|nr:hypothetical protein [Paramagnetospirillum magnetotacticum]KIL97919.1 hypothetical protein CCC_00980 [Paramagnetospirillum magnetotacticum MS-1]
MSDEHHQPAPPPTGRRYKAWEHSSPEEVAFSRKIFYGMMIALAILLGALTYGALR